MKSLRDFSFETQKKAFDMAFFQPNLEDLFKDHLEFTNFLVNLNKKWAQN